MIRRAFLALPLAGLSLTAHAAEPAAGAGRVAAGEYVEIDESGTPNPLLKLRLAEVTPNLVTLEGLNGWVAFAAYDAAAKEYRGYFEWRGFGPQRAPAGKWADLFEVRLTADAAGRLTMTGKSKANEFAIRATKA